MAISFLTQAQRDSIVELYIAYFNRAPEAAGLNSWSSVMMADMNAGKTATEALKGIANQFYAAGVQYNIYSSAQTVESFITTAYANALGRTSVDAAGMTYWTAKLVSGDVSRGEFVQTLIKDAKAFAGDATWGWVSTYMANRVAVGNAFADNSAGLTGAAAIAAGSTALSGVTAALAQAGQTAAQAVAAFNTPAAVTGQTFTLTASTTTPDDITGTAAADTFTASLGRLQDADALNGAGGNDVLNARLGATVTSVIASIETLNIEATSAASLEGANITGATNVNVTGGNTLTYLKQDGEAFSVAGAGTGLTVSTALTDSSTNAITVTLGAGKLGSVTVGDKATTDYEIVNLIVAGVGSATLVEADSGNNTESFADTGDKIVVTGSGDYTLNIASALLGEHATTAVNAVIDAAGHTGKLTIDLGTVTAAVVSAKTWTGVDVIALGLETNADILSNVASGTEVVIKGSSAAGDILSVTPNGTGTTDTLTITLNAPVAGAVVDISGVVVDGFETTTINSTGTNTSSATVVNVVDDVAGTTTDIKLIITGDKKLIATGIESTFTNITVTNTVGSDLTVDAGGALTYTGGAVADRLELDTIADLTAADTLVGGDGRDTLAFSAVADSATFSAAQKARVSSFEILEYTGTQDLTTGDAAHTIDVSDFSSIDTVRFVGALTTDAVDILTIKANDGVKVVFGDAVAITTTYIDIQVKDAGNAGTNNTVTVALEKESAGAALSVDGWNIGGVENQVIEVKGVMATSDIITVDAIKGAQLQTLTIKSTSGVDATTGLAKVAETIAITAVDTTLMHTLDATAATGAVTFVDISAFIATGATLKGGSAVDTFTGGVGSDVIQGNAGADILNGDTGNDNIDGGAGADNINGDVGADVLTGGTGKDIFVVDATESTVAAMDSVTDFKALAADQDFDTLDLTSTTVQANVAIGSATDAKAATSETDTAVGAYIASGIIKLTGADAANVDTFAEWIAVAELMLNAGATADSTGIAAFEFSGSTYVVREAYTHAGTASVTDTVIKLVGVTGITGISGTEATNVIDIG